MIFRTRELSDHSVFLEQAGALSRSKVNVMSHMARSLNRTKMNLNIQLFPLALLSFVGTGL